MRIKIINRYYLKHRNERNHEIVFSHFHNESRATVILSKKKKSLSFVHGMLLIIKSIGLHLCSFFSYSVVILYKTVAVKIEFCSY